MATRRFHSRVDWTKLAEKLEHAAKDPKVSPENREKSAVSARHLRKLKPLRDKIMSRARAFS